MKFIIPAGFTIIYAGIALRLARLRKRGAWFEVTWDFVDASNYEPAARRWLPWFFLASIVMVLAWAMALTA